MYLTLNIFVVFEIIIVLLKLKNLIIMLMVVVCLFVWDDDVNDWKSIAFISQNGKKEEKKWLYNNHKHHTQYIQRWWLLIIISWWFSSWKKQFSLSLGAYKKNLGSSNEKSRNDLIWITANKKKKKTEERRYDNHVLLYWSILFTYFFSLIHIQYFWKFFLEFITPVTPLWSCLSHVYPYASLYRFWNKNKKIDYPVCEKKDLLQVQPWYFLQKFSQFFSSGTFFQFQFSSSIFWSIFL